MPQHDDRRLGGLSLFELLAYVAFLGITLAIVPERVDVHVYQPYTCVITMPHSLTVLHAIYLPVALVGMTLFRVPRNLRLPGALWAVSMCVAGAVLLLKTSILLVGGASLIAQALALHHRTGISPARAATVTVGSSWALWFWAILTSGTRLIR